MYTLFFLSFHCSFLTLFFLLYRFAILFISFPPLPPLLPPSQSIKELDEWDGQSQPTVKHQKGKVISPQIKNVLGNKVYQYYHKYSANNSIAIHYTY